VLPGQPQADGIGGVGYHSISGTPARAFAMRAMAKSRSDSRFR
jgi:hypothetical protein